MYSIKMVKFNTQLVGDCLRNNVFNSTAICRCNSVNVDVNVLGGTIIRFHCMWYIIVQSRQLKEEIELVIGQILIQLQPRTRTNQFRLCSI